MRRKNKKHRQTRADRRRDQRSKLWRKRRKHEKENRKWANIQARNVEKPGKSPAIDTSLKNVPMMERVIMRVMQALRKDHQRQKR